jgi:hypothetical protein
MKAFKDSEGSLGKNALLPSLQHDRQCPIRANLCRDLLLYVTQRLSQLSDEYSTLVFLNTLLFCHSKDFRLSCFGVKVLYKNKFLSPFLEPLGSTNPFLMECTPQRSWISFLHLFCDIGMAISIKRVFFLL